MIDIHTHILPHLDDGAKDTATACAMLQTEKEQGVETVVLSSHYYGKKYSPARYIERRNAAYEHLKPKIPDGLQIRLAAEVHFTGFNMPAFDELCKLAIEGTDYILLEFPFMDDWKSGLLPALSDFVRGTGCTPIIAHVERYKEVKKNPLLVSELIHMGCLIQVNARAFLEKKDRSLAFALLKHGMVHCIGSDAHDTALRSPDMTAAKAEVEKAGFITEWEMAQNNMRRVIANEEVRLPISMPIRRFFGKYL